MNICTKYGFDILIISGTYGGHRRHTTYDGRRTTPRVWHKLPTGELKKLTGVSLVTDVHLIYQQLINDLLTIIKVGQQRSRMPRLVIITARRFLARKN